MEISRDELEQLKLIAVEESEVEAPIDTLKKKHGLEGLCFFEAYHTSRQKIERCLGVSSYGYDGLIFCSDPERFESRIQQAQKGKMSIWFADLGRIYDSWDAFRKDLLVWKLSGI